MHWMEFVIRMSNSPTSDKDQFLIILLNLTHLAKAAGADLPVGAVRALADDNLGRLDLPRRRRHHLWQA